MADEMTYNNGYHYVRDDNDDHDDLHLAALVASNGDASRDIADAGRDLTGFIGTSGQHVDIMSAVREEGGDGKATTWNARGHVSDLINHNTLHLTERIMDSTKENVIVTLQEGSRGRETTLEAKSDLMREHCETQKLVIKEASDTRIAVREEAERTRELIRDEHRSILERELAAKGEENTLLKLQINLLSSGTGPLSAK